MGIEGGGTGTAFRVPLGRRDAVARVRASSLWLLTGLTADEWLGFVACRARLAPVCPDARRATGSASR